MVSAVSIRRSHLTFSWSSSYLSRPCHASRCFINISKNRRRPVFLTCRRSLRSNSWKLQAKLDAIHVLTKEEYTVWLTVKSVFFYFFFFLCMTASEIEMGGGTYLHLWIDVRRESVGLCLPSHTSRCSPLVPSPRSWAKERVGPRWEGGGVGKEDIAGALESENLLLVKKEGESQWTRLGLNNIHVKFAVNFPYALCDLVIPSSIEGCARAAFHSNSFFHEL